VILPGSGRRVELGKRGRGERPARRLERAKPPARPPIVSDGVELVAVWFPHRDAAPLLSDEYPEVDASRQYGGEDDIRRGVKGWAYSRWIGGGQ
jgi:hypothetical protein